MVIRPAKRTDAAALAKLLPDLGYEATPTDIERRLSRLETWPHNAVIVAEDRGSLLGLCHVQGVPLMATDGYAEVQALVVVSASQRLGIGRLLLRSAIEWSSNHGYSRVRLRSGLHRESAHLFYEALGFSRSKPSYSFETQAPMP